jgi:DNA-binding NarL/FixJ family response regulator
MSRIRVLYVEDDPALMDLVSKELRAAPGLDLVFSGGSFDEAIEFVQKKGVFDVALVDLNLGKDNHSGLQLAVALRGLNPNCGLVVYSQYASKQLSERLPVGQRFSFSVLQKRAPIDFELLVTTIVKTAQGYSSMDKSLVEDQVNDIQRLSSLSLRDHEIMRMLVDGKNTEFIAKQLFLAPVTIRQDLSRIYAVLVPNRTTGSNLRSLAVTRYLEEARSF